MSTITSGALVPIGVRGMNLLEREKFARSVVVPVLKVSEDIVSKVSKIVKPYYLKLENFKPVQNYESNTTNDSNKNCYKCIYLNPKKVVKWTDFSEGIRLSLIENNIDSSNFLSKCIQLGYDNWKSEEIFKSVLPENEEAVSGFSQIGHIIHLNLKEHLLDFKTLIGQVLVDKIKTCRTVVNKCNTIDNTYRNFEMEVIAGEEDFLVTVRENQCNFQFDFSKVYWNPRLGKEHERILSFLKPGDVLFDVFCGVGPFSIPAAKKKCKVFANDLNPDSYKWLNHNAKSNKVDSRLFNSFNLDGKDFIVSAFKDFLIGLCKGDEKLEEGLKIHVTMNLPAIAVEFLQYFNGLIADKALIDKFNFNIKVHVYCFATSDDSNTYINIAKDMVNKHIGCDVSQYITDIFSVRNVSPKKEMLRVSFDLTKEVLFKCEAIKSDCEPAMKKICLKKV